MAQPLGIMAINLCPCQPWSVIDKSLQFLDKLHVTPNEGIEFCVIWLVSRETRSTTCYYGPTTCYYGHRSVSLSTVECHWQIIAISWQIQYPPSTCAYEFCDPYCSVCNQITMTIHATGCRNMPGTNNSFFPRAIVTSLNLVDMFMHAVFFEKSQFMLEEASQLPHFPAFIYWWSIITSSKTCTKKIWIWIAEL